jgi:hypothetical protein
MPTTLGYHDVATVLLPRPSVAHAFVGHLIASPFGTIEPARYTYARPIGTAMPPPPGYQLASFDPDSAGAKIWPIERPLDETPAAEVYPTVNRTLKGDRLPPTKAPPAPARPAHLPQLEPIDAVPGSRPVPPAPLPVPPATSKPTHAEAPAAAPPEATGKPAVPAAEVPVADDIDPPDQPGSVLAFADDSPPVRGSEIFFGASIIGSPSALERWAPGAEPEPIDPAVKLATLEGAAKDEPGFLKSPAERLGLAGPARVKAEKCLTDAVYFEARGESLRGQQAVAQVVMNRVFSGYYPKNVCGVVFQNANRYLACQFTFACEHKDLSRIDEPDMWAQAKRIAKDTLDGKIWLADIGHATHYHAYWVHPSWVHEMRRLNKLGVHTFYRPRAWGPGDDEPVWGPAPHTSKADVKVGPQADAAGKGEATAKL